jgi:hypothetical protein
MAPSATYFRSMSGRIAIAWAASSIGSSWRSGLTFTAMLARIASIYVLHCLEDKRWEFLADPIGTYDCGPVGDTWRSSSLSR